MTIIRGERFAAAILTGLVLVATTAACGRLAERAGSDAATAGDFQRTVTVAGQERGFVVHVPDKTGDLPVLLALHGGGGNAEVMAKQSGLSQTADENGFIVVYPNGSGRTKLLTWNAGTCCAYARENNIDDVAYISAVLDSVGKEFTVDEDRVFVTGFSNGAMMTYVIGCRLADRVTAIAPISGALNIDDCQPAKPLPVLVMHGLKDQVLPYDGGPPQRNVPGEGAFDNRSVKDSVGFWTTHDKCPEPKETKETGATVTTWSGCADGTGVVLYTLTDGAHAWPGGTQIREQGDAPVTTVSANDVMWNFFSRY